RGPSANLAAGNVPAPRARRSRPALRPGLAVLGLLVLDDRGEILHDLLLHGALVHAGRREHAVAVLEFEEREEDVLGADVVVPESQGFAEGQLEGLAGTRVVRDEFGDVARR